MGTTTRVNVFLTALTLAGIAVTASCGVRPDDATSGAQPPAAAMGSGPVATTPVTSTTPTTTHVYPTVEATATPTTIVSVPEPRVVDLRLGPEVGPVRLTAVVPDVDGTVVVRGTVTGDPVVPAALPVWTHMGTVVDDSTGRVGVAVPDGDGRFGVVIDGLADGSHWICPDEMALAIGPPDAEMDLGCGHGCGAVVLGELSVGTTGRPEQTWLVAPPVGHALHLTERDAGESVVLSDGSIFWVFGDTAQQRPDGGVAYFVNNTAAWAAAEQPTATRDGVDEQGRPFLFAAPPEGICDDSTYSRAALWPESVVAIPQADGTDRVVVIMSTVCVGSDWLAAEEVGLAVVEYVYDPTDPPVDQRIRGEITQPELATTDQAFGRAATVGPDGYVYTQHCGCFTEHWGPCVVARVRADGITDPSAWRYWNGGDWTDPASWVADVGQAAPMQVPDTVGVGEPLPVAGFDLAYDDLLGVYVMAYTPWPGFCGRAAIRVSTTPVGPWTPPVEVTLPDCTGEVAGMDHHCYAVTAQVEFDAEGLLGLGYFDMVTDGGVAEYRALTVPFVVVAR